MEGEQRNLIVNSYTIDCTVKTIDVEYRHDIDILYTIVRCDLKMQQGQIKKARQSPTHV